MAIFYVLMGGLAALMLLAMFTELFGVLFQSMKANTQAIYEHDNLHKGTYARRRRQLWIHVAVVGGLMLLFLYFGAKCWLALEGLSGQYFTSGRDRYGEALFGGGGLFVLALACAFRLGIIRAKFKAIKGMRSQFVPE